MKTIEPVSVWYNGQEQQATVLSAYASYDNLNNAATFSYQLMIAPPQVDNPITGLFPVASGTLSMTGEVYDNWETNDYAYDWVAEQLNLTITGEYVPPTPPQPEPPQPEITEPNA